MLQTSFFVPDDVGRKGEFQTDQDAYETLEAVNTEPTLLLDDYSMIT